MNQGKLDMVKQEMARLNSHILRIIMFFEAENGEVLHSQQKQKRLENDCGWDHQPLTAKFRLRLKKVGKIISPFRYDLNQIPYDYIVEVTNRFKGLDLADRVPAELWTEIHNIVLEALSKTIPKWGKKWKKAKWLSEEALPITEQRREEKGKGEQEIYTQLNAELQRRARRDRKVS